MLIELLYECQEKLWAWREGFYPWSGGLAGRISAKSRYQSQRIFSHLPAKVATGFREILFTIAAGASYIAAFRASNIICYTSGNCRLLYSLHQDCGNCFSLPSFPFSALPFWDHIYRLWWVIQGVGINSHPEGLVENNFCLFQIFVRNFFLFPDILQSLQQAGLCFSQVMSFKGLILLEAV